MVDAALPGRARVRCPGARREPEPLTLERVRGQRHAPGTTAGVQLRPVHLHPGRVCLGQGGQEPPETTLVPAQRPDDRGVVGGAVRLDGVLHRHREHGVRRHLDEAPGAVVRQGANGLLEAHPAAQVPVPVASVQGRGVDEPAGRGGVERHLSGHRLDRRQDLQQLVLDRLDVSGVRGVVHRDPAGPHLVPLADGDELVERVGVTRDHHHRGAVHRGDRHAAPVRGEEFLDPLDRLRHRHHAATTGQPLADEPAAQGHDPGAVGERQTARHARGRDLALGVAHHRRGLHTVRAPQRRQRDHHGPQRRLHHVDPLQRRSALRLPQHVLQPPVHEGRQRHGALRHPLGEHRRGVEQFDGHARPLRPLAREHEDRLAFRHHALDHTVRGGARRQCAETREQFVAVRGHHGRAPLQLRTRRHRRQADVHEVQPGPCREVGAQPLGLCPQRRLVARGHQHRHDGGPGGPAPGRPGRQPVVGRGLFEDQVCVGAADTERRDARAPCPSGNGPFLGFRQQLDLARGPFHVR